MAKLQEDEIGEIKTLFRSIWHGTLFRYHIIAP